MKPLYAILFILLGAVICYLMLPRGEGATEKEIIRENAILEAEKDSVKNAIDSIEREIKDRDEIIENLRNRMEELSDESKTVHIIHEKRRDYIINATDSGLLRVIADQRTAPDGY